MKTLVLLILLNSPDGGQAIQSATAMPADDCRMVAESIALGASPTVRMESDGERIPQIDAACISDIGERE